MDCLASRALRSPVRARRVRRRLRREHQRPEIQRHHRAIALTVLDEPPSPWRLRLRGEHRRRRGILHADAARLPSSSCNEKGSQLPGAGEYGVGMIYLPRIRHERRKCEILSRKLSQPKASSLLGWRTVPTRTISLGNTARRLPSRSCGRSSSARDPKLKTTWRFERKLYVIRKLGKRDPLRAHSRRQSVSTFPACPTRR